MSDGSAGIDEIIQMARRRGLSAIAITDHDTQAGNTRAKVIGERQGITVIPGIEISAYDFVRNKKVHILGYLCDKPDRLEGLCKQTGESRKQANQAAAQAVIRRFPITADMIMRRAQGSTNLYKQHIMHALIDAGCSSTVYGDLHTRLFSRDKGLAFSPLTYPDVYSAIDLIKDAGGITVLAHPALYGNFELLPELAEKGLDGVEIWHPSASAEDVANLKKLSADLGLLMTGGSDFHGMYSAVPNMIGSYVTPDEHFARMLEYKKAIKN